MLATGTRILCAIVAVLAVPAMSFAVIVIDAGGSPTRNLNAPTGLLDGSGWQYEGNWGAFSGTPIAPNYFITATHVGGTVGQTFTYAGSSYTTTAKYSDPDSDLTIWEVSSAFSSWAPLYTGSSEVGQSAMIFGRGVPATTNVIVDGNLKGWGWVSSSYDGKRSWGQNTVVDTVMDPSLGRFLVTLFEPVVGQNEAQLAYGDSGGGLFINNGGTWELAGLNYSVDGPYKYSLSDTSSFEAALFDQSGLFWETQPGTFAAAPDQPSASYYSSISGNLAWIGTIVPSAVPEPGTAAVLSATALLLLRRHR